MEDYKRCSTQGQLGMEVLGTKIWSCKIEVEKMEEIKGRSANLQEDSRFALLKLE
jgi:hypothetical protein